MTFLAFLQPKMKIHVYSNFLLVEHCFKTWYIKISFHSIKQSKFTFLWFTCFFLIQLCVYLRMNHSKYSSSTLALSIIAVYASVVVNKLNSSFKEFIKTIIQWNDKIWYWLLINLMENTLIVQTIDNTSMKISTSLSICNIVYI